jgi:uncharacterized protein (DUF2225 family)
LGLGNLTGAKLFEKDDKAKKKVVVEKAAPVVLEEKDYIFDKTFECPICDTKFTAKVMKNSKAKLLSSDIDLRQKFEGVDAVKYDAIRCNCGYTALSRYFPTHLHTKAEASAGNAKGKNPNTAVKADKTIKAGTAKNVARFAGRNTSET